MKIEEGKFYRTRDGRTVGPAENRSTYWCMNQMHYMDDGKCAWEGRLRDGDRERHDLVAEWAEPGPVRTVTRKEIVGGVYGMVHVDLHNDLHVIHIRPEDGYQASATDLRAAAATLIELADALEDGK